MKRRVVVLTAGVVMFLSGLTGAAPVTFNVYDDPDVEVGVSFTYSPIDASHATITVWLDNLSGHQDARISGFGFNVPDGTLDEVDPAQGAPFLVYTPDNAGDGYDFVGMTDYSNGGTEGIAADGYGHFDMAAFNGPDGDLNDGFSTKGIADSGTFVFTVTGRGLDALDEMSFLSLYSGPPSAGEGVQPFVVRWQDLDSGSGFAVPEPSSALVLILGICVLRRRRRC